MPAGKTSCQASETIAGFHEGCLLLQLSVLHCSFLQLLPCLRCRLEPCPFLRSLSAPSHSANQRRSPSDKERLPRESISQVSSHPTCSHKAFGKVAFLRTQSNADTAQRDCTKHQGCTGRGLTLRRRGIGPVAHHRRTASRCFRGIFANGGMKGHFGRSIDGPPTIAVPGPVRSMKNSLHSAAPISY